MEISELDRDDTTIGRIWTRYEALVLAS